MNFKERLQIWKQKRLDKKKASWETEKQELLLEIEKLKNRLDILEAPDYTLVDSAGNIFASKDGNYFVTKQLN